MRFLWFQCDVIIISTSAAILVTSLALAGYFMNKELETSDNPEKYCRMAEDGPVNTIEAKAAGLSAFVLGYTGEVGRALVEELNRQKIYKRVVLIGRREVPDLAVGPEFEQIVVDFENLDEHKDAFKGIDHGFCCLGTTRGKAGVQGFIRVDHDYVLLSAEIAKADSTKHFTLVSSQGASKGSSFLYPRTKGQVEEALKVMHFDRLSIFRPGVLLVDRQENRPMEHMFRTLLRPVSYFFPTAITTPVSVVVQAMINNAIHKGEKVDIYENKAIHQLSGISKGCDMKKSASAPESSKTK